MPGVGDMPHAPVDLATIAEEACATMSPLAKSKDIHLTTTLSATPVKGNAAGLRLGQGTKVTIRFPMNLATENE